MYTDVTTYYMAVKSGAAVVAHAAQLIAAHKHLMVHIHVYSAQQVFYH